MNKVINFLIRAQGRLRRIGPIHEQRKKYREIFRDNPNSVFLAMTPTHGNLGDQAIAKAEMDLLADAGIRCVEVTYWDLSDMRWAGLLEAMDGFPILLHGGGYLGTLWYEAEDLLRKLLQKVPNSPVLMMPNTIYYENTDWGREQYAESIKVYNRHRKLHIFAREKTSYEIMRSAYRTVTLMPDMVLSMNRYEKRLVRKGCLLCLRSDHERTRTEEQEKIIRQQAEILFGNNVADTDTVVNHTITVDQRESELQAKFIQFSGAELVITDRLHGMIFCAITGTPCIVIESKSPKVRGCYEWIRNLDYIRFTDDVSKIVAEYEKIPLKNHSYDNTHLQHYYDELISKIKHNIKNWL